MISDETFEYVPASDMTWGGFNWKLNFRWYRVPQREVDRRGGDRTQPLRFVICLKIKIYVILISSSHSPSKKLPKVKLHFFVCLFFKHCFYKWVW